MNLVNYLIKLSLSLGIVTLNIVYTDCSGVQGAKVRTATGIFAKRQHWEIFD
jgi:hypothetical protein